MLIRNFILKFVSYFTVFCELSRRVGGDFLSRQNFFNPAPGGGGVWEGTLVFVNGKRLRDKLIGFIIAALKDIRDYLSDLAEAKSQEILDGLRETRQSCIGNAKFNRICWLC